MKYLILILSIIFSIIAIPLSWGISCFVASLFDASPAILFLILGIIGLIFISIITCGICKTKFIRASIILPSLINCITTLSILWYTFGDGCYKNSCIAEDGDLYTNLGIKVINNGGSYYYEGIDEFGNYLIIGISRSYDHDYEDDDVERELYRFKYYNSNFQFIGDNKVFRDYQGGDDRYRIYDYDDAKFLIECYDDDFEITVYGAIG